MLGLTCLRAYFQISWEIAKGAAPALARLEDAPPARNLPVSRLSKFHGTKTFGLTYPPDVRHPPFWTFRGAPYPYDQNRKQDSYKRPYQKKLVHEVRLIPGAG